MNYIISEGLLGEILDDLGHGTVFQKVRALMPSKDVVLTSEALNKLPMHDHGDAFYYKCQDILDAFIDSPDPIQQQKTCGNCLRTWPNVGSVPRNDRRHLLEAKSRILD